MFKYEDLPADTRRNCASLWHGRGMTKAQALYELRHYFADYPYPECCRRHLAKLALYYNHDPERCNNKCFKADVDYEDSDKRLSYCKVCKCGVMSDYFYMHTANPLHCSCGRLFRIQLVKEIAHLLCESFLGVKYQNRSWVAWYRRFVNRKDYTKFLE